MNTPYSAEVLDRCTYDICSPASKYCFECGAPLCSFCGARDEFNNVYCNECYGDIEEQLARQLVV